MKRAHIQICFLANLIAMLSAFRLVSQKILRRPVTIRPNVFHSLRVGLPKLLSTSNDIVEVISSKSGLSTASQFTFVGGKGGVGKTSSSSAIALALSDLGFKTLIVSTDPAHSLGDALDLNLKSGKIVPVPTESNLYALEIDVEAALVEFKNTLSELDSDGLAASLGIPRDIVDSIGLDDLASIFTNPPPGVDEIVALTKIFQYAGRSEYDRIVIDTAPTGHTIRLLQLPEFLNSVVGKLIKLRAKVLGAVEKFKAMFGGAQDGPSSSQKLESVLNKLDSLQGDMLRLKSTLRDPSKTQFVVVTIPTQLAVSESTRLVKSLKKENIRVSSVICNQLLSEGADVKYINTRARGQRRCIGLMESYLDKLASTTKKQRVIITEVPFVDTEVTGLYGFKFFTSLAHPIKAKTATNPIDSRKITLFGGKGGVGKTTSAATWAVRLSESGFKTLVVSTDPAHSLGDALLMPLNGRPQYIDGSDEGGQLWAMEVDSAAALNEFQSVLQSALGSVNPSGGGGMMSSLGLTDIKNDLSEMLSGVNDPPPGTDEIVALTNILNYLENGYTQSDGTVIRFDRVVIDTAPTGHTLRMLELPKFLIKLIAKFKKVRDKTSAISSLMGGIMGSDSTGDRMATPPTDRLAAFESRIARLEVLLHSEKDTEFSVVTIPTEVAMSETERLLSSLSNSNVLVRRLIINQIIPSADGNGGEGSNADQEAQRAESYLNKLRKGQSISLNQLELLSSENDIKLIRVPYFDMEVRTVYGLRAITSTLFPPK